MKIKQRMAISKTYLGKSVDIVIDRPIGYVHKNIKYPVNYGYIPGVFASDGEEQDVYLLGVNEPQKEYSAEIIGVIYRDDDNEDKLVAAPKGKIFNQAEIMELVHFQEQFFKMHVDALYQKSCGAVVYKMINGKAHYLCLLQKGAGYSVPKGHTEAFEKEEETAKRELFEEVGITADFKDGFREEVKYKLAGNRRKKVVLFLAEYNGEIKLNGREISEYHWLDVENAKKTLPRWYMEVIDKAEEYIGFEE